MSSKRKRSAKLKAGIEEDKNSSSQTSNYEVESIIRKQIKHGKEHYLVKWKGYSESEATWQPKENMTNCSSMIVEFEVKKLTRLDKHSLTLAAETNDSADQLQEYNERLPQNIYDHDIEIVESALGGHTLSKYRKRIHHLYKMIQEGADQPSSTNRVHKIIGTQFESVDDEKEPESFRVILKDGSYCIISRFTCYKYYQRQLLDYYESLIEWQN